MNYARFARPNVQGVHFKADKVPVASVQQDFFEAVAQDDSLISFLTPEQLGRLRVLEAMYRSKPSSSARAETPDGSTGWTAPAEREAARRSA